MRYCITIFLLCSSVLFAIAQKTKTPAYFYTQASEKYLTDAETDSLMYHFSAEVFTQNMIPAALFEKKYPRIKYLLVTASKKDIVLSFKEIETKQQRGIIIEKGTPLYNENKKLYLEALQAQITKTYNKTPALKAYLSFNNSDRITFFNSTVRPGADGKLLVTENITIYNGNGRPNPLYGDDPL